MPLRDGAGRSPPRVAKMKWWLITIVAILAVAIGLAGGLFYTWGLDEPEDFEAAPDTLRVEDKLVYLLTIGDLYAYEEDLDRARDRLALVDVEAEGQVLAGFLEQYLEGGGSAQDARNLARLARALGASGGVLVVFDTEPVPTVQPTATSVTAPDASVTAFPTPTPVPGFGLAERTAVCAGPDLPGRITMQVLDASGEGMAGVEIVVTWAQEEDRLFTGLRPDEGPGYADFEMMPGVEYEVKLAGFGGDVARALTSDLSPGDCPTDTVALDWRLTFQQAP